MDESGKRALWTKVVADFELSGQSQRAYAEAHRVELSNLRYWIYKLRNESRPLATEKKDPPPAQPEQAEQRAPARASRMLPVRVVASPAPKAREAVADAGLLELALPSGARLRFPAGTDLDYVRQLVAALQVAVLTLPRAVRIFISSAAIDMRKSIDGLMAIVKDELEGDVYSGHLFVFVSRRCDRVKILTWDKGGFVLFYKRLERGQFRLPHMDPNAMAVEVDATQLAMLLDGIDYSRVRRPEPWMPQKPRQEIDGSRRS